MRALRVLGIAENGAHLVCVGDERTDDEPETFTLPLDDRLRAAVRGDLSRFGQLEIEMEPQLRPREIQSRIRAGASVEQVAAAAGCTPERIERYAYPVLMERSTIAERARKVRPLQGAAMGSIGAASSTRSLEAIVTGTLADRGLHPDLSWDAFRDERGWTVTVTWRAGRSENRAEWAYHSGPDGGSVAPRNQEATDLVDPAPRPLRTIGDDRPARNGATGNRAVAQHVTADHTGEHAKTERTAADHTPAGHTTAGHTETGHTETEHSAADHASADHSRAERLVADTVIDRRSGALPPAAPSRAVRTAERTGTDGGAPSPSPATGASEHHEAATGSGRSGSGRSAQRGHRPPMPSWEDVLLGTRASGR